MSEEKKEVVLTEEQKEKIARDKMYEFLQEKFGPTAPNAEKVEEWKARYRRVRFVPFGEDEIYFIRPIKRSEYKALVSTAQASGGEDAEVFLQDRIVSQCVLWPVMDTAQFADGLGGTAPSLYTAIMDASNFISQDALFSVIREL